MKNAFKAMKTSFTLFLLGGAQLSVLLAIVASQAGERAVRGARGFAAYRANLTA